MVENQLPLNLQKKASI